MPGLFHTIALPLRRYAGQALSWPLQDPTTIRTCKLDCTVWLRDAGTTIASAFILADPTIETGEFGYDTKSVWLTIRGGTPGTYPVVSFKLLLADGNRENINVIVPIVRLEPVIPDDAITVDGQAVTVGYAPAEVSHLPSIPGGVQGGDLLLVVRPGANPIAGTTPYAALESGGSASEYVYEQTLPATTWDITHNLNKHPSVSVVTSGGDMVMAAVKYETASRLVLSFANGFAGTAYLH